jgi:hypothetical protein
MPDSPLPDLAVPLSLDEEHLTTDPVVVSASETFLAVAVTDPPGDTVQVLAEVAKAEAGPGPSERATRPPLRRRVVKRLRMCWFLPADRCGQLFRSVSY